MQHCSLQHWSLFSPLDTSIAECCSYFGSCIAFLLQLLIIALREGNGTPLQYSCLEIPMDGGAWWAAVHGVAKGLTWLSDFTFIFHFHALEKEMTTHSSVLAWRIPGTGEPGGLPPMGSHRVGNDWSDLAAAAAVVIALHSSPLAYWTPSNLQGSSSGVLSFVFSYYSWDSPDNTKLE